MDGIIQFSPVFNSTVLASVSCKICLVFVQSWDIDMFPMITDEI